MQCDELLPWPTDVLLQVLKKLVEQSEEIASPQRLSRLAQTSRKASRRLVAVLQGVSATRSQKHTRGKKRRASFDDPLVVNGHIPASERLERQQQSKLEWNIWKAGQKLG